MLSISRFSLKHLLVIVSVAFAMTIALLVGINNNIASAVTANTLKITPVRSDIEVMPGEARIVKVTVTNLTGAEVQVSPTIHDFIAGDERGTPSLILDADKFAPTHSLKRFIQPLENIAIAAGQAKTVNVSIFVPEGTQAGGYFGAVRFAPASPDGGAQVNLAPSVASIILLTVPGETVDKVNLTQFDIQQDGKTGTSFGSTDNLQLSTRFENKGNVQVGPTGKVSVKKGNTVVYESDFNKNNPKEMILPDSARRWDVPLSIPRPAGLSDLWGFGEYKVYATLTYGKSNQTIEVEKSFWVIPAAVVILGILVVILLVGIAVAIWFTLRRRRHAKVMQNLQFKK